MGCERTGTPAAANTWAIPAPMIPAPMTAVVSIPMLRAGSDYSYGLAFSFKHARRQHVSPSFSHRLQC